MRFSVVKVFLNDGCCLIKMCCLHAFTTVKRTDSQVLEHEIKSVPRFTFFGTMRLTGNFEKKYQKKFGFFFSIFSFLRAFVVSNCRKSGF